MLTDVQCRNATCSPDKKRARLTDAGGLYLEINPAGSRRWFWKIYADGKEKRLALGSYRMDTRAAQTAKRSYQASETVKQVHRAKKPRG